MAELRSTDADSMPATSDSAVPASGGNSVASGAIGTPPSQSSGTEAQPPLGAPSAVVPVDDQNALAPSLSLQEAQQSLNETAQLAQTGESLLEVPQQQGFMHFIAQSDLVGKSLFGVLIVMSLVSWYLIIVKGLAHLSMKRRSRLFLERFWQSGSLDVVARQIEVYGARDPFSHLTQNALHAREHHARFGVAKLEDAGTESEFVMRTMRKVIDEETAQIESGLTVLASIGSTAPFVGLFGTVWGVYHALVAIGMGGGATIDRIAGPVGEALIMTGLGLAVAIPAVLGFNAYVRRNRVLLARLDAFAYDLFTVLTTGQRVSAHSSSPASPRQAA